MFPPWSRLKANLRAGIAGGIFFASCYAAVATGIRILGGEEPFQAHGSTFLGVLAAYYAAGLLAGIVTGLLLETATTWWARLLICILDAHIAFFCFAVARVGPRFWLWPRSEWEGVVVLGTIFGFVGLYCWNRIGR